MDTTRRIMSLGAVPLLVAAAVQAAEPDLRSRMQGLFGALTQVSETLSATPDADHREDIEQLLGILAADAGQISRHAEPYRGEGFRLAAGSVARGAGQAMVAFEAGDAARARELVGEVSGACFACHSTLPATASFVPRPLPPSVETLPFAERMRWSVVAREFESAMKLGESALLTGPTAGIDATGVLEDYLVVAIRVRGDLATPRVTLALLAERENLPPGLKPVLEAWIEALAALGHMPYSLPKLETARQMLAAAPEDRRGMVQVVAASALLHQFAQSGPDDTAEAAEAYLLLGGAEDRIRGARDAGAACAYLEAAVRLAPGSEVAAEAFARLDAIARELGPARAPLDPERLEELRTLATR